MGGFRVSSLARPTVRSDREGGVRQIARAAVVFSDLPGARKVRAFSRPTPRETGPAERRVQPAQFLVTEYASEDPPSATLRRGRSGEPCGLGPQGLAGQLHGKSAGPVPCRAVGLLTLSDRQARRARCRR